jgi:hypothetical protein
VYGEHHSVHRTLQILRFTQTGDTATVIAFAQMTMTDQAGKTTPYPDPDIMCGITGYYQDVWVKNGNIWQLKSTRLYARPTQ